MAALAVRLTTVNPDVCLKEIAEGTKRIKLGDAAYKQWGIEINPQPMEVMALVHPKNGCWNGHGVTLYNPVVIERWYWVVIVFNSERSFARKVSEQCIINLIDACLSMGIKIADQRAEIHYAPLGGDAAAFMRNKSADMMTSEGAPPQLIVCFLTNKRAEIYADIKRFGDQEYGVATQCLIETTAQKLPPSFWFRIALKINVKMHRSVNWILVPEARGPAAVNTQMILSGSVSHAPVGSLALLVALIMGSMDTIYSTYGSAVTVHPARFEIVARAEEMALKLLKQYHTKNGVPPDRLIFLRKGFLEGQFSHVMVTEVVAIRLACARFNPAVRGKRRKEEDRASTTPTPSPKPPQPTPTPTTPTGTMADAPPPPPTHPAWANVLSHIKAADAGLRLAPPSTRRAGIACGAALPLLPDGDLKTRVEQVVDEEGHALEDVKATILELKGFALGRASAMPAAQMKETGSDHVDSSKQLMLQRELQGLQHLVLAHKLDEGTTKWDAVTWIDAVVQTLTPDLRTAQRQADPSASPPIVEEDYVQPLTLLRSLCNVNGPKLTRWYQKEVSEKDRKWSDLVKAAQSALSTYTETDESIVFAEFAALAEKFDWTKEYATDEGSTCQPGVE
ncbi:hypothetical protein JCM10449v2_004272 [Rhodotorula kratochvilovae]